MKLKFRHSYQSDLEQIYKLHAKCFNESDRWYKSSIKHYLNKGIVIENVDKNAFQTYYLRKLHELDNIFPAPAYLHNLDHAKGVLVRAPLTHEIHLPFTHPSIVSKYNLFVNRPA